MIKKYLSCAAILFFCMCTFRLLAAELSKTDQIKLKRLRTELNKPLSRASEPGSNTFSAFITIDDEESLNELEQSGLTVINRMGDMLIVSMPIDSIEKIAATPSIRKIELASEVKISMDNARAVSEVNQVHSGEGLSGHNFTGEGTLVGLFDCGFDLSHPNFDSRTEVVYFYPSTSTTPNILTGNNINTFTTDQESETHGSHVLGIMAGGKPQITTSQNTVVMNPYYGVAPDARIMVGCTATAMYNTLIIDAIKRMTDYADQQGLPAIINLSLGGNSGPHDKSSDFSQWIATLGEKATIVISAGNEGDDNIALSKTFDSNDKYLKTFLLTGVDLYNEQNSKSEPDTDHDFFIEAWSNDNTSFDATLLLVDTNGNVKNRYNIPVGSSSINLADFTKNYGVYSSGVLSFLKGIEENNRYVTYIYTAANATTGIPEYAQQTSYSQYKLAIEITGKAGQRIDLFNNGSDYHGLDYFSAGGVSTWDNPDGNMSINSMAAADNIVVIGAYLSRKTWSAINGYSYSYKNNDQEGDIAGFSSFGTLIDGTQLPHISAPGSAIISSYSHYYTDYLQTTYPVPGTSWWDYSYKSYINASTELDNNNYYWGIMQGTSMACPFAAGTFALWQQASMLINKRRLSFDEIISIAQKTATKDDYVINGNGLKWGAGKLNAYDGIKEIMSTSSSIGVINDNLHDKTAIMFNLSERLLDITIANASELQINIFSTVGTTVISKTIIGNSYSESLSSLPSGIYVIRVNTSDGRCFTRKFMLR